MAQRPRVRRLRRAHAPDVRGDSHGGDIAGALLLALGTQSYDYARRTLAPACFSAADRRPWVLRITNATGPCQTQLDALRASRSLAAADYVFIADRWTAETIKGFEEGLAVLRTLTPARIILVGQNATFPTFDDSLRFLAPTQLRRLNRVLYEQQSAADVQVNEQLRRLAAVDGLGFIDRQSLVCSRTAQQCQVVADGGNFLYSDTNHWSYAGLILFGRLMVEQFGSVFGTRPGEPAAAQH